MSARPHTLASNMLADTCGRMERTDTVNACAVCKPRLLLAAEAGGLVHPAPHVVHQ